MLFELSSGFWLDVFHDGIFPSKIIDAKCSSDPFGIDDVVRVHQFSEPEEGEEKYFLAGLLKDGRHFYMEGDNMTQNCFVADDIPDLVDFGMTDEGRVFLPEMEKLAAGENHAPVHPGLVAKVTIYLSNEWEASQFEKYWVNIGHKNFQNFLEYSR